MGEYAEVIVLDPQDLNVLFTLSSRVEPDWISSLAFFKTSENIGELLHLTQDSSET